MTESWCINCTVFTYCFALFLFYLAHSRLGVPPTLPSSDAPGTWTWASLHTHMQAQQHSQGSRQLQLRECVGLGVCVCGVACACAWCVRE